MAKKPLPPIEITVGVCSRFTVKLKNTDFTGIKKIILTVKNKAAVDSPVIIEREFTEQEDTLVTITPQESVKLKEGAVYDFNKILEDGTRHSMGNRIGKIILINGVGGCIG